MKRVYIAARLQHELVLRSIRDSIYNKIEGYTHYRKKDPHITIVPPFKVHSKDLDKVYDAMDSVDIVGKNVDVTGLSVWRNIHKPHTILLNVDCDIDDDRITLKDKVEDISVDGIRRIVRPHITIMKSNGWSQDLDIDIKRSIQNEILYRNYYPETQIKGLFTDIKDI